jgi:hypothetical protein
MDEEQKDKAGTKGKMHRNFYSWRLMFLRIERHRNTDLGN